MPSGPGAASFFFLRRFFACEPSPSAAPFSACRFFDDLGVLGGLGAFGSLGGLGAFGGLGSLGGFGSFAFFCGLGLSAAGGGIRSSTSCATVL